MQKVVFTGGPSSGKTTTLNMVSNMRPELSIIPEQATLVIKEELAKQSADPDYQLKVPWTDYTAFNEVNVARMVQAEAAIPDDAGTVLLDRSIVDAVGYLHVHGLSAGSGPTVKRARAAGYDLALYFESISEFEETEVRRDKDLTEDIGREVLRAFEENGIDIVHVKLDTEENRAKFIIAELAVRGLL